MSEMYLTTAQVATRYQVSRETVWRWVRQGRLPQPYRFSPQAPRWSESELEAREATVRSQSA